MCIGAINKNTNTKYHAVLMCLAALDILNFVKLMISIHPNTDKGNWKIRIGINCGPIVGGVVGKFRPTFDIWGNAVNIASRMESSGQKGRINISETTYQLVKDYFEIEPRGELEVKNNQKLNMYFLNRIKSDYSNYEEGTLPNEKFLQILGL